MNRRIHKKLCKRAMATLIKDHGWRPEDFTYLKFGDEITWDAPANMERRCSRGHSDGFFTPLKGTPGRLERTSYEYDEWEFKSPVAILDQIEMENAMSDEIDQIGWAAFEEKYFGDDIEDASVEA